MQIPREHNQDDYYQPVGVRLLAWFASAGFLCPMYQPIPPPITTVARDRAARREIGGLVVVLWVLSVAVCLLVVLVGYLAYCEYEKAQIRYRVQQGIENFAERFPPADAESQARYEQIMREAEEHLRKEQNWPDASMHEGFP